MPIRPEAAKKLAHAILETFAPSELMIDLTASLIVAHVQTDELCASNEELEKALGRDPAQLKLVERQ